MTVKQLKEELKKYSDDTEIIGYEEHFEDFLEVTDISPCTMEGHLHGKLIISLWET